MSHPQLIKQLPFLRRYTRALLGSQQAGDDLVRQTLQSALDGTVTLDADLPPRVSLYKACHTIWSRTPNTGPIAQSSTDARLQRIDPASRVALLLTSMEGFSLSEAASILSCPVAEAEAQVIAAQTQIDAALKTRVLIIEDEWIIALDLRTLVLQLGHEVMGVAHTRTAALELARTGEFGLVLADIQLADGSSGIDAVTDILNSFDVPVIFITAFPDRLLTGERPEPTYLITKPFLAETVKATIAQALFFHGAHASHEPAVRIA